MCENIKIRASLCEFLEKCVYSCTDALKLGKITLYCTEMHKFK